MMPHDYEKDGAAIYARSFATIRAEADLARFTAEEEPVVVRKPGPRSCATPGWSRKA